ncbi:hypothetical protein ACQQ2Q_04965 [Agrobacterium sp. ES01]
MPKSSRRARAIAIAKTEDAAAQRMTFLTGAALFALAAIAAVVLAIVS